MAKRKKMKITVSKDVDTSSPSTRNYVSKHMREFNKSVVMIDRKKRSKSSLRNIKHKGRDSYHNGFLFIFIMIRVFILRYKTYESCV